jgi:hypothetical protein
MQFMIWIRLVASNHITNSSLLIAGTDSSRILATMSTEMQKERWKTIFLVACWYMCKWRNKSIFDEDFRRPSNPTHVIMKMAMDIDSREHNHLIRGQRKKDIVFIGWKRPPESWIKLNCDGAYKESVDLVGCGGLLRDSDGRWIQGYTQKIGACDALHAEMWGMYT